MESFSATDFAFHFLFSTLYIMLGRICLCLHIGLTYYYNSFRLISYT